MIACRLSSAWALTERAESNEIEFATITLLMRFLRGKRSIVSDEQVTRSRDGHLRQGRASVTAVTAGYSDVCAHPGLSSGGVAEASGSLLCGAVDAECAAHLMLVQGLSEEWRVGLERSAVGKGAGADGVEAEVVNEECDGLNGEVVVA